MDNPEKRNIVLSAISSFLECLEKLEQLIDPDERTTVDDTILKFLRMLVDRL